MVGWISHWLTLKSPISPFTCTFLSPFSLANFYILQNVKSMTLNAWMIHISRIQEYIFPQNHLLMIIHPILLFLGLQWLNLFVTWDGSKWQKLYWIHLEKMMRIFKSIIWLIEMCRYDLHFFLWKNVFFKVRTRTILSEWIRMRVSVFATKNYDPDLQFTVLDFYLIAKCINNPFMRPCKLITLTFQVSLTYPVWFFREIQFPKMWNRRFYKGEFCEKWGLGKSEFYENWDFRNFF